MWIEVSCWMDLGHSLESYFLLMLRVLVFFPPWSLTSICLPIVHARSPSPSGFSLSCQCSTLSHFWFVACDLVIYTLIH